MNLRYATINHPNIFAKFSGSVEMNEYRNSVLNSVNKSDWNKFGMWRRRWRRWMEKQAEFSDTSVSKSR